MSRWNCTWSLSLALFACGGSERGPKGRSVVLITLDTTTPGSLDPYSGRSGVTPSLTALAERGVVFENARSVAPLTLPAHTSMLTGLYPIRHTVRDNGHLPVPESADTLAEHARDAGYRTAAFLAAGVLAEGFGLGQGFEVYETPVAQDALGGFATRWAGDVTKRAVAWLDQTKGDPRPFFLWVHYFDPHAPYNPPPKFAKRFPGKPYLAEVSAMDAQIGKLVERLSAEPGFDEMTILVVGDHGEAFGTNGEGSHGMLLHDATLRVPLIVRFPGHVASGTRRSELVSVVDVFPTLMRQMQLDVVSGLDGEDLLEPTRREGVYAECYSGFLSYGWAPLAGWATVEGLYVHGARPAVDRTGGDGTLTDAPPDSDWVQRAREALDAIAERPALPRPAHESLLDSDLVALGYAGGGGVDLEIPHPLEVPDGLPSPTERLDERERAFRALSLADAGRLEDGIELLRSVAEENPRNVFVHDQLGNLLLRAKRPRRALVPLRAIVDAGLDRPSVRRRMAIAHTMLGEYDAARDELARLLELCPDDPQARKFRDELERQIEDAAEPGGD